MLWNLNDKVKIVKKGDKYYGRVVPVKSAYLFWGGRWFFDVDLGGGKKESYLRKGLKLVDHCGTKRLPTSTVEPGPHW